jgi:hypothetical protein
MIVYNYSATTGEFLGKEAAFESPLEEGVYLYPANSTTIAPPKAAAGQVAVFVKDAWSLCPDFRGTVYWTEDQKQHVVTEIGEMPTEAIVVAPPASAPNQKISYANGAWAITPDFIGETYWTADGVQHTVTELGDLPSGSILTAPPTIPEGFSLGYSNDTWTVTPNAYNTQRAASYPMIGDQLDMLWHTIDQGLPLDKSSSFYKTIAEIKAKYPKPGGSTT